jgi:hypothetical protein
MKRWLRPFIFMNVAPVFIACEKPPPTREPMVRALQPVPESPTALTTSDHGTGQIVGDARWSLLTSSSTRPRTGVRKVLVVLEVTNLGDQPTPVVRTVTASDDLGTQHQPLSELDRDNPTAPRSMLAEPPLLPRQSRQLRFVYELLASRTIISLELPALNAVHGSRTLLIAGGELVPSTTRGSSGALGQGVLSNGANSSSGPPCESDHQCPSSNCTNRHCQSNTEGSLCTNNSHCASNNCTNGRCESLAAAPPVSASGSDEVTSTDWSETASSHRGEIGRRFRYRCPADGGTGNVWGTGVYTDDSSICTAAVHADRITVQRGGIVTIEISGGRESYRGSARNGIESDDYGDFPGSFGFTSTP